MHLMYTLDENGNRVYTLKVCPHSPRLRASPFMDPTRNWRTRVGWQGLPTRVRALSHRVLVGSHYWVPFQSSSSFFPGWQVLASPRHHQKALWHFAHAAAHEANVRWLATASRRIYYSETPVVNIRQLGLKHNFWGPFVYRVRCRASPSSIWTRQTARHSTSCMTGPTIELGNRCGTRSKDASRITFSRHRKNDYATMSITYYAHLRLVWLQAQGLEDQPTKKIRGGTCCTSPTGSGVTMDHEEINR